MELLPKTRWIRLAVFTQVQYAAQCERKHTTESSLDTRGIRNESSADLQEYTTNTVIGSNSEDTWVKPVYLTNYTYILAYTATVVSQSLLQLNRQQSATNYQLLIVLICCPVFT